MSAVNLPNSITLTRIFSIPLLSWILSTRRFHGTGGGKALLASALFIAAWIRDGIDGSGLGKFKMLVQIVSVVAVILDHRWKAWYVGRYIFPVHWIAFLAIWFMVFLSLVSAVDYFAAFWSKIDRRVVKRRRRAFVLSRRRKRDVPAI